MGFLQRVMSAGLKSVPVRAARGVRRVEQTGESRSAARAIPEREPSNARESHEDLAGAVPARPRAEASPAPAIGAPVHERPSRPTEPVDPPLPRRTVDTAPSSPPPAAAPVLPATPVPVPVRALDDASRARASDVTGRPFPRVPALSDDGALDLPQPPLPAELPPRLTTPMPLPTLRAADPAEIVRPPRVEPVRMERSKSEQRPSPALQRITAPEQNVRLEPSAPPRVPVSTVPVEPERDRSKRESLSSAPPPPATAVAQLIPPAPRVQLPARQAATSPGLTIHKLELHVVERPRETSRPVVVVPVVPPSPEPWDGPDRRHHGLVW